ncbi:spermidine synthase [Streptacidiphilus melanogenes]|uniref:spermidine synthase n=1 Tax=Streptacidiphilus melanogenes TaxID=411235 RepID=UPI00126A0467|nr:spermidine synthase [Streptacidiphilus melanogenes]
MSTPHADTPPVQHSDTPELLDRREGPFGEVALRRRGAHFEIIANGTFLMDTSDGRSERLLVSAALDALDGARGAHLLIGGLGVGFSLAEAAQDRRPGRITVVERERAIIDWHTRDEAPLAAFAGTGHADPRTEIVHADLLEHLRTTGDRYDALCLDIDNGPDWTVTDSNDSLYSGAGLDLLTRTLADGGVLAVWSAAHSPAFEARLRARFARIEVIEVPVHVERGVPDVVYLSSRG